MPKCLLNTVRLGASTPSQRKLFQGSSTLGKEMLIPVSLNLLWRMQLSAIPTCPGTGHYWEEISNFPLHFTTSESCKEQCSHPSASLSPNWVNPVSSAASHRALLLALQPASVSSFCTHLRTFTSLLKFAQKCTKYSKWNCSSAKKSGMITPFDQLVVVHLMVCHCWLWACCLVSQHAQAHFCGVAPQPLLKFVLVEGMVYPRCRVWHLFLFSIMLLMIVQHSNPSISLCKASCPLRVSTAPPTLAPSANLLTVHLTPASRSLIKTVNRTGREPRGVPLSTTLWALPFSQFFQQPSTCSLHSQTCPEGCWEVQCSILFNKTQENYIHHIPSSTRQVKWQNLQAYWNVKTFKRLIKLLKKESTLVYLWYAFFSLCLISRNVSF